jgi:hypothetical protein
MNYPPELRYLHIHLMTFITEIHGGFVSVVTFTALNFAEMRVMGIWIEFVCFRRHLPVVSMAPQADGHRNILLRRVFFVTDCTVRSPVLVFVYQEKAFGGPGRTERQEDENPREPQDSYCGDQDPELHVGSRPFQGPIKP